MIKLIKPAFAFMLLGLLAGSCNEDDGSNSIPGLYEEEVFLEAEIQVDEITYGSRSNFNELQYTSDNTKETEKELPTLTLKLDMYTPPNAGSSEKQPLLVMIHGGGFSGGDKNAWRNEAYTYSRAGYICASLNYRLTQSGGNQSPELRLFAVQCALEDIQNAIRFLKANANTYFIDTTRIVVFGGSAGGSLSLTNAVEYDAEVGTNDFPEISSKTKGSISTGSSLINDDPASQSGSIQFDAFDSPVLMFHAKEFDSGGNGYTWTDNAVPTQQAIVNSGNTCTLIAQPNMTHTVVLELGGEYWQYIKPFLKENLRLDEM
ncbi:MAG TPA: alpha/beta hydrolase [Cyclobacteriaceae bacterium]|nr:alpha/beta hydrolase [Cyclobacteriaceae bacterium]